MTNPNQHNDDVLSVPSPDLFSPDDLVWDRSGLVDAGATAITAQLNELVGGDLIIERIWLERTDSGLVKDGHLEEGGLNWVVYLKSPAMRTTKAVSLLYPVSNGLVEKALYFKTSDAKMIPLTREHLMNYIQFNIR